MTACWLVDEQPSDRCRTAGREYESRERPTIGLKWATIVHMGTGRVLERVRHELCDRRVASRVCRDRRQRCGTGKGRASEEPRDTPASEHASSSSDGQRNDERRRRTGAAGILCHGRPYEDSRCDGRDCYQGDRSCRRM